MSEKPIEEWRPIKSLKGYEVSNQGRVRKGDLICSIHHDRYGSPIANVNAGYDRNCRISRAVGEAFCPDFRPELRPKFLDGDKNNCKPENLKWVSVREVSVPPSGELQGRSKLTWAQVDEIRASKLSGSALGAKYGVSKASINDIHRHKTWKEENRPKPEKRSALVD